MFPTRLPSAKNAPVYRYIATRELLRQPELPGMEVELPFPTMTMEKKRYKVFGIVTNRDMDGSELVNWLHKRCGKSEEAHSVMKGDLAGGKLPSCRLRGERRVVGDHDPRLQSQHRQ